MEGQHKTLPPDQQPIIYPPYQGSFFNLKQKITMLGFIIPKSNLFTSHKNREIFAIGILYFY